MTHRLRPIRDMRVALSGLLALALLSSAALLISGCLTRDCTLLGWTEGLSVAISFEHEGTEQPLADGSYQLNIVGDGERVTVDFDVVDGIARCRGEVGNTCFLDGDRLRVNAWLDASLPSGEVAVALIDDDGGPAVVTVELEREGVSLGLASFEPKYERSEPNGAGCGTATTAHSELRITAP